MSDSEASKKSALHASMVSGSVWMVSMRWSMRLIGVVSTVVLARLLTPDDFGIIAMSMIVFGFLELVTVTGVDLALIRDANATEEHYNTAWSIRVIQGVFLAFLLLLCAPFGSDYFNEPRVGEVIRLMALIALIQGFENIGVVAFRKDLAFAKEFRFGVAKKLLSLFAVIGLALLFQNYYALVGGLIFGTALGVILSYAMHPFRPHFTLSKFSEIWGFSQWLLVSQIGLFLSRKTDQIVIGGLTGTTSIGYYHLANELATMPTNEVVMPMRRALYPTLARLISSPDELSRSLQNLLGIVAMICVSTGVGIAVVSEDLVLLLLGEKWLEVAPLIEWLALFGIAWAIASCMEVVLLVTGNARLSAAETWGQFVFLVPVLLYASTWNSVEVIAAARTLVSIIFVPVMWLLVRRVVPLTATQLLATLWRPVLAGVAMVFAVKAMPALGDTFLVVRLAFDIAVGAIAYVATLTACWIICGRPPGPESSALQYARNRLFPSAAQ